MKNDNTIFWIIGIAIVVFLILPNLQKTPTDEFATIKVHYYDKYGHEVFPSTLGGGFSIGSSIYSPDLVSIDYYDPSLADDDETTGALEPEDLIEEPKKFSLRNLISQIGLFSSATVPPLASEGVFPIEASFLASYCYDPDSSTPYDLDMIMGADDIGTDFNSAFTRREICNGLLLFPVTTMPIDLTSETQIIDVVLYTYIQNVYDDSGYGVDTDIGTIYNLEDYDYTANTQAEIKAMYDELEKLSAGFPGRYSIEPQEHNQNWWLTSDMWGVSELNMSYVKEEIIDNMDGNPSGYLAIGLEGERSSSYNEYFDINKATLVIYYTPFEEPTHISFEVTATNFPTSEINYTGVSITDATPVEFKNALPTTSHDLPIGSSQTWYSDNITIKDEWKGTTQTFEVWVSGTNEYTDLIEGKYASTELIL